MSAAGRIPALAVLTVHRLLTLPFSAIGWPPRNVRGGADWLPHFLIAPCLPFWAAVSYRILHPPGGTPSPPRRGSQPDAPPTSGNNHSIPALEFQHA
jgi:hypothetical protein